MLNTALRTHPLSYSKVCDTFRAADCSAARTHLGGEVLINLDVLGAVPYGFVAELGSKLRPAGIENGLSQAGSGESGGIHLADADAGILAHKPRRDLMQEVSTAIRDLGVQGAHSALAACTLRDGELLGVAREIPWVADFFASGKAHEAFEAQIDADLSAATVPAPGDLELEIEIPPATRILREATAANPPIDGTAKPQSVAALEEDHRIAVHANGSRRLEGNPTEGFAAPPSAAMPVGIARASKLFADGLYHVRVKSQLARGTVSEVDQLITARPASVPTHSGSLGLSAEVPHEVYATCLRIECSRAVFDAIAAGQNHLYILTVYVLSPCHNLRGFQREI